MIEELNELTLHVCLCRDYKTPLFVAHCLELDLMGDGITKDEAILRLKKTTEIQYGICKNKKSDFFAYADRQWVEYHLAVPLGSPEDTTFVLDKCRSTRVAEAVRVPVKIDKTSRILSNKEAWINEFPLQRLIKLLSTNRIFWHPSEELDYGYLLGHWPADSDGPLQSYAFYAPPDTMVRWYHLRSIASRFWLDDLRSRLLQDNGNIEE
jgi:hypothetical protein